MKRIILSLSLAIGMFTCGCSNAQNQESEGVINKDVDVQEFAELVAQGKGLLLDVRTDEEFSEGHLKGATQINFYGDDFEDQIKQLDAETPVYVYCRSGGRSGKAAKLMKTLGFIEVYNLEGGINAWQQSGKPVAQ